MNSYYKCYRVDGDKKFTIFRDHFIEGCLSSSEKIATLKDRFACYGYISKLEHADKYGDKPISVKAYIKSISGGTAQ